MASDKTNVMRVLEQHKIAYKPHEYPHGKDAVDGVSVAELLGQNPRSGLQDAGCTRQIGRLSCIRYSGRKGA